MEGGGGGRDFFCPFGLWRRRGAFCVDIALVATARDGKSRSPSSLFFSPFFISSFPSSSYDRWPHLTLPPFSPPPHTWVKKRDWPRLMEEKHFWRWVSTVVLEVLLYSTVPVSTAHLVIKEKSVSSAKTFFSVWGREMQCRGKLYLYRMLCAQRTHANAVLCLYLYPF